MATDIPRMTASYDCATQVRCQGSIRWATTSRHNPAQQWLDARSRRLGGDRLCSYHECAHLVCRMAVRLLMPGTAANVAVNAIEAVTSTDDDAHELVAGDCGPDEHEPRGAVFRFAAAGAALNQHSANRTIS
jgi:hypothetical protein